MGLNNINPYFFRIFNRMRNQLIAFCMCFFFICSVPFTQESRELLPDVLAEVLSDLVLFDIEHEEGLDTINPDLQPSDKEENKQEEQKKEWNSYQSDIAGYLSSDYVQFLFYETQFLLYAFHAKDIPTPPPKA